MIAGTDRRSKWWIWLIVAVVVLAALGGLAWWLIAGNASNPAPSASPSATATPTVSATPTRTAPATPTPRPTSTSTPTATPTPTPVPTPTTTPTAPPTPTEPVIGTVIPFISYAGWDVQAGGISVSASVPGVVESDGTCTITASSASGSYSQQFPASPSATTTECGSNVLTSPDLVTGTWTVVVTYSSAVSTGSSSGSEVDIP